MKRARLNEHEAFRHLQKMASRENMKLVQISEMIVTAEAAFEPTRGHR
jgi:response regulator NasT